MTLRYQSSAAKKPSAKPDKVVSHSETGGDEEIGSGFTPPPIEYVPADTTCNLEDKEVALGRLQPELKLD